MAKIIPQQVPKGEGLLQLFYETFSRPLFMDTCLEYLAGLGCRDAFVNCILIHKEQAHPQPVTLWHADQATENRLSFKFMVYLEDCTVENGAFSYAPGTHRVVHEVITRARAEGLPDLKAHSFEQIKELAYRYELVDSIRIVEGLSRLCAQRPQGLGRDVRHERHPPGRGGITRRALPDARALLSTTPDVLERETQAGGAQPGQAQPLLFFRHGVARRS